MKSILYIVLAFLKALKFVNSIGSSAVLFEDEKSASDCPPHRIDQPRPGLGESSEEEATRPR